MTARGGRYQNWLRDVAESVRREGVVESPIGEAKVPFIGSKRLPSLARGAASNAVRRA
jgi:hypothetical protein